MNEKQIRDGWCDRLWKRKGYDSPDEFKEPGNCFACGMAGDLKPRAVGSSNIVSAHLLCVYCRDDCKGLTGFGYWRWFLKRTATDTVAAHMKRKLSKLMRSGDTPMHGTG